MGGIGVIEKKFLASVKLLPWAQFFGAWLAVGGLLLAALGVKGFWFVAPHIVMALGVLIGALSFTFSVIHKPGFFSLRHLLSGVGLLVAAFMVLFLGAHPVFFSLIAFVALGFSQAGQWYDEIYP